MTIAALAAGTLFACTPVAVWDGDGPVWCKEGPRLRIAGIAARELDNTCRPHHPCPKASGIEARDALVRLLGGSKGAVHLSGHYDRRDHIRVAGPTMQCRSDGNAKGGRTAAICQLPDGRDLACAHLATGTVVQWKAFWRGRRCPGG